MFDLVLKRKKSKKARDYFLLEVDLGYRTQILTYDTAIICSLCKISEEYLFTSFNVDDVVKIGTIDLTFKPSKVGE